MGNVPFRIVVGFILFKLLVWIFWLIHLTVVVLGLTVYHLVQPLSSAQRKINLSNWNSQILSFTYKLFISTTFNNVFLQ